MFLYISPMKLSKQSLSRHIFAVLVCVLLMIKPTSQDSVKKPKKGRAHHHRSDRKQKMNYPLNDSQLEVNTSIIDTIHINNTFSRKRIKQRNCVNINATPPMKGQRIPYHTHIRKSMGSTICNIALLSSPGKFFNLKIAKDKNCNMEGDGPKTMAHKKGGTHHVFANRYLCCADRYQAARGKQKALIARELYLDDFFCPQWFAYSVILRQPISRIMSHFNYQNHRWSNVEIWINQSTFKYGEDHKRTDHGWPLLSGTGPYNNYHVRIFGGFETYFLNIDQLNHQHLEKAKNIINMYEVVIILEKFEEQKVQLSTFFGWNLRTLSSINNRDSKKLTPNKYEFALNETYQIQMLREVNQLDLKFYAHSIEVANNLTDCAKKKCKKVL